MEHLKELRKSAGLLQKDVAAFLGIDRTTYVKYENGQSEPPFETLTRLADYFHVSVDYLLGGKEKKPIENDELLKQVEQANSNMAVIIGKGMDRKVVQVPPEAEAIIKSAIEAFEKNNK